METKRKPYPSDVSDEEWVFVAPYLTLMTLDALHEESATGIECEQRVRRVSVLIKLI